MFKYLVFALALSTGCSRKADSSSTVNQTTSRCSELKKEINSKINVVARSLDDMLRNFDSSNRSFERATELVSRVNDGFLRMESDPSEISWYSGYARDLNAELGSAARDSSYLRSDIQKIRFPFSDGSIAEGIDACQGSEFSHDLYARRNQASTCAPIVREAEYSGYWLSVSLANSHSYSSSISNHLDSAKWGEDISARLYDLNLAREQLNTTVNSETEVTRYINSFRSSISALQSKCL